MKNVMKRGRSVKQAVLLAAALTAAAMMYTGNAYAQELQTAADEAAAAGFGETAAKEGAAPKLMLGSQTLYAVKQEETVVTVPIYAFGADMRACDMVITYDTSLLAYEDASLSVGEDTIQAVREETETLGTVYLSGAALGEEAASAYGQVGTVTFRLARAVKENNLRSPIGLTVRMLGPDTPRTETKTDGCIVTLSRKKAPQTPEQPVYYGDANKDGEVTASDALAVLKHVVHLSTNAETEFDSSDPLSLIIADTDENGVIDASDALEILKTVVKLQETRLYIDTLSDAVIDPERESYPQAAEELFMKDWNHPALLDIGDIDQDGLYTAADALCVLETGANADLWAADGADPRMDVDGDGELTKNDAELLIKAAAGYYTNFGYAEPADVHTIYVDCKGYTRGSSCFGSLKEAVAYVNSNPPESEEERVTLLLAPGTYRENTNLTAPYVTFKALDSQAEVWPVITYYYGCERLYYSINGGKSGAGASNASTTIASGAHDFSAEHIMFENSYNIYITKEELDDFSADNFPTIDMRRENLLESSYQTQGLALCVNADKSTFYDCRIIGRQDTLLMNQSNRVYYENCYIEGTVDFIYGSGTAVLQSCTINSPYNSGHITAASTPEMQPYGFLFKDCKLTCVPTAKRDAPKEESYSLGRPWNGPAMVTFYNCRMDRHISNKDTPNFDRFVTMRETYAKEQARYAEYGTMDIDGNVLDLTVVCPSYEKILTQEDMNGFYAPIRWLEARFDTKTGTMQYDGWNPGGYTEP